MVWAILVFVGVPLWICALGVFTVIDRNRALRQRRYFGAGVQARQDPLGAGTRRVGLGCVRLARQPRGVERRPDTGRRRQRGPASPEEQKRLNRLGDDHVVATMVTDESTTLRVAVASGDRAAVLGPFQSIPTQNASGD